MKLNSPNCLSKGFKIVTTPENKLSTDMFKNELNQKPKESLKAL